MTENGVLIAVPTAVRPLADEGFLQRSLEGIQTTGPLNDPLIFKYGRHLRIIRQRLNDGRYDSGGVIGVLLRLWLKKYPPLHEQRHQISTWTEKNHAHTMGDFGGQQSSHATYPLAICSAHSPPLHRTPFAVNRARH